MLSDIGQSFLPKAWATHLYLELILFVRVGCLIDWVGNVGGWTSDPRVNTCLLKICPDQLVKVGLKDLVFIGRRRKHS
jgi:hypothetical protein